MRLSVFAISFVKKTDLHLKITLIIRWLECLQKFRIRIIAINKIKNPERHLVCCLFAIVELCDFYIRSQDGKRTYLLPLLEFIVAVLHFN